MRKVGSRPREKLGIILELTQSAVAGEAQDSARLPRAMIVVKVLRLIISADGTRASLGLEKRVEVRGFYSVSMFQEIVPNAAVPTFAV